jgi:hypothetical protein
VSSFRLMSLRDEMNAMLGSCRGEAIMRWMGARAMTTSEMFPQMYRRMSGQVTSMVFPSTRQRSTRQQHCTIVGSSAPKNLPTRLPSINQRPKGGVRLIAERRRINLSCISVFHQRRPVCDKASIIYNIHRQVRTIGQDTHGARFKRELEQDPSRPISHTQLHATLSNQTSASSFSFLLDLWRTTPGKDPHTFVHAIPSFVKVASKY